MSEWMPIESAPKEGPFIVFGGAWCGEINGVEHGQCGPWIVAPCGARFDVMGTDAYSAWVIEPTHWMPLPPPPEIDQ